MERDGQPVSRIFKIIGVRVSMGGLQGRVLVRWRKVQASGSKDS